MPVGIVFIDVIVIVVCVMGLSRTARGIRRAMDGFLHILVGAVIEIGVFL